MSVWRRPLLDFKRRNCDKLHRNIMPKKAPVRKKLNRQEKRDLDIEIGFLEGLVKRDAGYVDALQILGDDYTKRGKFTLGLKIDQRLSSRICTKRSTITTLSVASCSAESRTVDINESLIS